MAKTRREQIARVTRSATKHKQAPGPIDRTRKEQWKSTRRATRFANDNGDDIADDSGDDDDAAIDTGPQYKEDINAFSGPIESDSDYISRLPNEVMEKVLSFVLLDHDPDRAVKKHAEGVKYVERPHVLLSLAAMSRHLHAQVEGFSIHHLLKFKDVYKFQTTAEKEGTKKKQPTRRSARLTTQPVHDSRAYRFELVKGLRATCIKCDGFGYYTSLIPNYVGNCCSCYKKSEQGTINLTQALKDYDLRDYMLIPSRKPGPRARHTDLPTISYYTRKTGTAIILGNCITYRFKKTDVARIAGLVHGTIKAHMKQKRELLLERRLKRQRHTKRELKIRYHKDSLAKADSKENKAYHAKRKCIAGVFMPRLTGDAGLYEYEAMDPDFVYEPDEGDSGYDYDSDSYESVGSGYGDYDDIHKRLCIEENCCRCQKEKLRKAYEKNGLLDYLGWCSCGMCW